MEVVVFDLKIREGVLLDHLSSVFISVVMRPADRTGPGSLAELKLISQVMTTDAACLRRSGKTTDTHDMAVAGLLSLLTDEFDEQAKASIHRRLSDPVVTDDVFHSELLKPDNSILVNELSGCVVAEVETLASDVRMGSRELKARFMSVSGALLLTTHRAIVALET